MIVFLITQLAIAYGQATCKSMVSQVKVYPAVNEYKNWNLTQFFTGDNLQYKFDSDPSVFKIRPPFYEVGGQKDLPQQIGIDDPISLKPYYQDSNGVWMNQFAFIDTSPNQGYVLYYATGTPLDNNVVPDFQNTINIVENEPFIKCFDLAYLDSETFVVDCADESLADNPDSIINYFYIVKKTDTDPAVIKQNRIRSDSTRSYKTLSKRKIQYHDYTIWGTNKRIIIRGAPAYITGTSDNLDTNSIVEIFIVDAQNKITNTNMQIDRGQIANDINYTGDHETFEFKLIDFDVTANGDIYILDASNGIYVYQVQKDKNNLIYKKKIETYTGVAYAFDVNYRLKRNGEVISQLAVMYDQYILIKEGDFTTGYATPNIKPKFPAQIILSQKYILAVSNNVIYQYSVDSRYLIGTLKLFFKAFIVNPYEPDLILITNTVSQRYLISHGYLAAHSTTSTGFGSFKLQAVTEKDEVCEIPFEFKVLEATDTTIYTLGVNPFPEVITYPADPFKLNVMAAGPNLKYTNLDGPTTGVNVRVYSTWDLNITGAVLPAASNVIYSDLLVDKTNENNFYFLLQTTDLNITIYYCQSISTYDNQCDCKIQDKIKATVDIDRSKSSWDWYSGYENQITFYYQTSPYTIGIFVSDQGKTDTIKTITYDSTNELNKITSYIFTQEGIYVVQQAKKTIDYYYQIFPVESKFTIDEALVKKQGYKGTWAPKQVFANKEILSQIVFIHTDDFLLMCDFNNGFTLMKQIPVLTGAELDVAVGKETFFVVQFIKATKQSQITEFSFEALNYIQPIKIIPLYGRYQFQSPLTVDYSFETGFLFIRALDITTQKTVILVYQPDTLQHQSLHKVIETNELIPDETPFEMCVSGEGQMFIYLNDKKQHKVLALLQDALMVLLPNVKEAQYVTKLDAGVQLSNNFAGTDKLSIKYPVKFLNTQSIPKIDEKVLEKDNKIKVGSSSQQQILPLGSDWYQGQVVQFVAECQSCASGNVTVRDLIHPISDKLFLDQPNDVAQFKSYFVYLFDKKFEFVDSKGVRQPSFFEFSKAQNEYCTSISASGDYIITGCFEGTVNRVYITQCTDKLVCTAFLQGSKDVAVVQNRISKLQYINEYLYLLDSNNIFPTTYQGQMHIYRVSVSATAWDLVDYKGISQTSLNSQFPVYLADFDVTQFQASGKTYTLIVVSDAKSGLYFITQLPDSNANKNPSYLGSYPFNLYDFLNSEQGGQFARADTYFYQTRFLKNSGVTATTLSVTLLVTTNNVAHYGIIVGLNVADIATAGAQPQAKLSTVPFLFNQYGTWDGLNKLSLTATHAAISYTNRASVLTAIYKIPNLSTLQATTSMIPFSAGLSKNYATAGLTSFISILTVEKDQPYLQSNLAYDSNLNTLSLLRYQVDAQPSLIIKAGSKVQAQEVTIIARNDFSQSSGKFNIQASGGESSGSSNWWWITLLVLAGLAIVGGLGFLAYKKVKGSNVQPLLD